MMRAPLIGLVTAVLLVVAFFFVAYQPRSDEQAEFEAQTAALADQQEQLARQIAELRAVAANQVEIRAALGRLEELIPTGFSQPAAIRQFQVTADASGVALERVTFDPPAVVEGAPASADSSTVLAEIPVTMTLEGGYFQMVDFFRRLEVDVPRAALVDNVSVAEGELEFPSLATTWSGLLFAVLPISAVEGAAPPAASLPTPGDDETPPADDDDDPLPGDGVDEDAVPT